MDARRLAVASGSNILVLDPRTGASRVWSQIYLDHGWVLNDGTADSRGRLWVGSVDPERLPGSGYLHVIEPDGKARLVADGITFSNGMAWLSPTLLVHADSLECWIWEHEVNPETATVIRSRRAVTLSNEPRGDSCTGPLALPDGLALDRDGCLWVAMYGTGQVWRLVEGRVDSVIDVPTPQVTSVALGEAEGCDVPDHDGAGGNGRRCAGGGSGRTALPRAGEGAGAPCREISFVKCSS